MSALIEFDEVCKYYQMGDTTVKAADHISMKIEKGEFRIIEACVGDEIHVVFRKIRTTEPAEDRVCAGNLRCERQNAFYGIVRQFAAIEIFGTAEDDCSVFGKIVKPVGDGHEAVVKIVVLASAGGDKCDAAFPEFIQNAEGVRGKLFAAVQQSTVHIGGDEFYHRKAK